MIDWTDNIKETILDGIVSGDPIVQVLQRLEISKCSFYRYRLKDQEFDTSIARAQEMAQEANIDETESMARSATVENWQLVQFQCRNAQWVAGKRKAKKYGDKVDLNHSGEVAIKRVVADL